MAALPQLWMHDETTNALKMSPSELHHMNRMRTETRFCTVGRYCLGLAKDVLDRLGWHALESGNAPEPKCRSPTRDRP